MGGSVTDMLRAPQPACRIRRGCVAPLETATDEEKVTNQMSVQAQDAASTTTIAIRPASGWLALNLAELWEYRELPYFLIWRDLKVRYRQTAFGVAWVVIQPLVTTAIFALVFGRLARLPSERVPYPLFIFAALLPWQLFSGAISRRAVSLVSNANLLTKVYFPRLLVPLAAVLWGLVDLSVFLILLVGMLGWYHVTPSWAVLTLPLLVVVAVLAAVAIGTSLAALNVRYRDIQRAIPFLIQIWFLAPPVAYSTSLVPSGIWRLLYNLNPMTGVIQGFRWALLGKPVPAPLMWISVTAVAIPLVAGLLYFWRLEDSFADVV
jgi:lipopolysaccharide transport system permease protein